MTGENPILFLQKKDCDERSKTELKMICLQVYRIGIELIGLEHSYQLSHPIYHYLK